MAIIITFKPRNPELCDIEILEDFSKAIAKQIQFTKLNSYFETMQLAISSEKIQIQFDGVNFSGITNSMFLLNELTYMLESIGLYPFLFISETAVKQLAGEKIFDCTNYKPTNTRNSEVLKLHIAPENIPERFICNISQMIMDNPMYIKGNPNVKMDKKHLEYWLFQKQNGMKDPFRNIPIRISDLIEDHEMGTEIRSFVSLTIEQSLNKKAQARKDEATTVRLLTEYKLPDRTTLSWGKGLRRAAAEKKLEDLSLFIKKVSDINIQDDTATSRRSALHWATVKESTACISELITAGADEELKDARGMSSRDYAQEATNPEIKKIFFDAHKKRSKHLLLFAQTQNFPAEVIKTVFAYLPSIKTP